MIKIGSEVGWLWSGSLVTGTVLEIYPDRHEIISKGKKIVRNGSEHDPAIVIQHSVDTLVLKLSHEVQQISDN